MGDYKFDYELLESTNLVLKRYSRHLTNLFSEDDLVILRATISEDSIFGFGFTGFKTTNGSSRVVGQVLAALCNGPFKDRPVYFAVNVSRTPRPFKYLMGDYFEMREYEKHELSSLKGHSFIKMLETSVIALKNYVIAYLDFAPRKIDGSGDLN